MVGLGSGMPKVSGAEKLESMIIGFSEVKQRWREIEDEKEEEKEEGKREKKLRSGVCVPIL